MVITQSILNEYIQYLKAEEKAVATIEKYVRDIRAFLAFLGDKAVEKQRAIEYKQYLLDNQYAVRSVNSIIASLNGIFSYMGCQHCKLKTIKIQRQLYCSEKRELKKEEYERLVKTANREGNYRLQLILQTICVTGIRVSELPFITVEAVRKGEAIVTLKGKTRVIFIIRELQKKLLRYIAEQKIHTGTLFVTRSGKPMSRTNIWREMKNLCVQAKVCPNKVFPHNLRHLFARTFYGIEKDIAKLADILGHSHIDTTRIYIATNKSEHRQRMEKMRLIL